MTTKSPTDPRDELISQLRAENEALRNTLRDATTRSANAPAHVFQLSEGARQELALSGVANVGGRLMTVDDARAAVARTEDQRDVDVAGPDRTVPALPDRGPAVYGVDYVYPSVQPGVLAPEAVGQPGVSGRAE